MGEQYFTGFEFELNLGVVVVGDNILSHNGPLSIVIRCTPMYAQ